VGTIPPRSRTVSIRAEQEESFSVNIAAHHIVISEDRLRVALARYKDAFAPSSDVVAPFTTLVTLLLTLATADFKAVVWFNLFLLLTGAVFAWLLVALTRHGSHPKPDVEQLLSDIKGMSPESVTGNMRPISDGHSQSPSSQKLT